VTADTIRGELVREVVLADAARAIAGRPATEAEDAQLASLTAPELAYAVLLARLHGEAASAACADTERLDAILRPAWDADPDLTTGEVLALLPGDVQAEAAELLARITGPDGTLNPGAEATIHYETYRRALAELDA
jgi:hypothetical protein